MNRIRSVSAFALAAALVLLPTMSTAAPVGFSFNGTVTGIPTVSSDVLMDYPVGTPASFGIGFDSASMVPVGSPPSMGLGPVSGQLALGTNIYQLDDGSILAYQSQGNIFTSPSPSNMGDVDFYILTFTGAGPTTSNGGQFFWLLLVLTPDLQLDPRDAAIQVYFDYLDTSGPSYHAAMIGGRFTQVTETPEPASWALVGLGLMGLASARRSRRAA